MQPYARTNGENRIIKFSLMCTLWWLIHVNPLFIVMYSLGRYTPRWSEGLARGRLGGLTCPSIFHQGERVRPLLWTTTTKFDDDIEMLIQMPLFFALAEHFTDAIMRMLFCFCLVLCSDMSGTLYYVLIACNSVITFNEIWRVLTHHFIS